MHIPKTMGFNPQIVNSDDLSIPIFRNPPFYRPDVIFPAPIGQGASSFPRRAANPEDVLGLGQSGEGLALLPAKLDFF